MVSLVLGVGNVGYLHIVPKCLLFYLDYPSFLMHFRVKDYGFSSNPPAIVNAYLAQVFFML